MGGGVGANSKDRNRHGFLEVSVAPLGVADSLKKLKCFEQKIHKKISMYTESHCNENPIYVFPEKELGGLSPNFHIHVSVMIYIFRGTVHIFSSNRIGRLICGNMYK